METIKNLLETSLGGISLGSVCSAIITFIIAYAVVKALIALTNKVLDNPKSKLDPFVAGIIRNVVKWGLTVLLIILVAESLGINTTSLVAAMSVIGLAVSMAVQSVLSNVAGGIMILVTHPFVVGDFVESGATIGTVESIGISYTKIKTVDNKIVCVPNGDLSGTRITNYSAEPMRRVDFVFTASYQSPVASVKKALFEALEETGKFVREPDYFIEISKYGSSSIEYTVRAWCENANYWDCYFGMNDKVHETFKRNGVEMTYDHIIVHKAD